MNITTKTITFLENVPKGHTVIKTAKSQFYKMYLISTEQIIDFLMSLPDDRLCLINPFISTNDLSSDPYLVLSKHFLVTSKSNPYLISHYLNNQLLKAEKEFDIKLENNYYLIFKNKLVSII